MDNKKRFKINIGILRSTFEIGGEQQVLYNWITNLDKERFNPIVFCLYQPGPIGTKLIKEGIMLYSNILRMKIDYIGIFKLKKLLDQEKIDIFYISNTLLTLFYGGIFTSWNNKLTFITGIHSWDHDKINPLYRISRILLNRILTTKFKSFIALSESHKKYLVKSEHIPSNKITIINNGVNLDLFQKKMKFNIKEKLGLPSSVPVVGIVAVLRPEKAHDIFLKAALLIHRILPQTHFLIIGDGQERFNLEQLSRDLNISKNVHFLGNCDNVPEILACIDVSVLTSFCETFPLTILEAMAASKPVVATDTGSVRDIIVDGETGIIVPTGDVEQIAEKILFLLRNKKIATKMGQFAYERAKQHFTIEEMTKKYETLFEELMNKC